MRYDFILFGGTGQQGKICARDLVESGYSVLLVGRNKKAIRYLLKNKKIGFMKVDLRNFKDIVNAINKSKAKVVVNCAEMAFNIAIMKACLKKGKPCTDLGGLEEVTVKQFKLDRDFTKKGLINITGCGSTPGISNLMAKHTVEHFDSVDSIDLGFVWDSNIKKFVIPYSIHSIFDELTKPVIVYSHGKFVKSDNFRCMGTYDFRDIGKQTVYCIVHSEVYTFAKYFKSKGLKDVHYMAGFPEHSLDVINKLIDLGFSSDDYIEENGEKIKIVNFTDKVLGRIKMPKGYKEIENIWVKVYGTKDGKKKESEMNCIVKSLKGWEEAGSNVDTGMTISIISQMLFKGKICEKGVYGPEAVVPTKEFFRELTKRKMIIYENGKRLN